MRILDRYLLRQFIWVFCIFFCSFVGLYIVADSVNNFEELTGYAEKNGGLVVTLIEYYGSRTLAFFDQVAALLILVTAMFTITAFRRHNEMTALMAAGLPKARIVRPIILAGITLCLLAAVNREFVIPMVRDKLSYNAQDLVEGKVRKLTASYDSETSVFFNGSGALMRDKTIVEPKFYLPGSLGKYGHKIEAKTAIYQLAEGDRPGGYLMQNVSRPAELDDKTSLSLGEKPIVLTSFDHKWIKPGQCFVVTGVDFEQLTGGKHWRQYSSTWEMIEGMQNPSLDYGANVRVSVHSRIVQPFLDITLLFLGLPLVLVSDGRNMFLAVGRCVLIVILFMAVMKGSQYLGSSSLALSPALAAWCPLMIFVPMAVGMSDPLRQ